MSKRRGKTTKTGSGLCASRVNTDLVQLASQAQTPPSALCKLGEVIAVDTIVRGDMRRYLITIINVESCVGFAFATSSSKSQQITQQILLALTS